MRLNETEKNANLQRQTHWRIIGTFKSRKIQNEIFQVLEVNNFQPRLLFPKEKKKRVKTKRVDKNTKDKPELT